MSLWLSFSLAIFSVRFPQCDRFTRQNMSCAHRPLHRHHPYILIPPISKCRYKQSKDQPAGFSKIKCPTAAVLAGTW